VVTVTGLRKRFGRFQALDGVEFTVPKGEIFGFVGPNGAGKTTTIRILATLTRADAGRALVGGIPVGEDPAAVRALIGYMPDFFGVYDRLTSEEYLEFYAACYGVPRRRRRVVAKELLELVDLGDRAKFQVDTLSRGQKQRLCLARALVHDPSVLLLDEPASGLDPRARVEMRELVKELSRMGKTILISSHILPELEELCTWVGFIDRGHMAAVGPMSQVRDRATIGRRIRIVLSSVDPEWLQQVAGQMGVIAGVVRAEVAGDHLEVAVGEHTEDHVLLAELVKAGLPVRSFAPIEGDLSEAFLSLTGDGQP
jgi:ABC-2 type transport system ATP-binding protein